MAPLNGPGVNIDFIIYAPYNNLTAAQNDCGSMGTTAGEVIGYSFSFTNKEFTSISNVQIGELYVMLITN